MLLYTKSHTLKHMNAGLWTVPHGIHEDDWQEFHQHNPDLWTHQFVSDHLGKERGSLLADRRVLRVAEQVQQVYQGTCGAGETPELLVYNLSGLLLGCSFKLNLQENFNSIFDFT